MSNIEKLAGLIISKRNSEKILSLFRQEPEVPPNVRALLNRLESSGFAQVVSLRVPLVNPPCEIIPLTEKRSGLL